MRTHDSMKGQVILITMMLLGASILGVVAGISMIVRFQLRQATDIRSSTSAIYAADTGIECELYDYFKSVPGFNCNNFNMSNGANFISQRQGTVLITSVGIYANTARAFEMNLQRATATIP